MVIVRSRNGVSVRLTEERWQHIVRRHPETSDRRERVLETVAEPDMIQEGDFGELLAIRSYLEAPLNAKSLVVAYREVSDQDGFVLTAYITNRPSGGRITIWRR